MYKFALNVKSLFFFAAISELYKREILSDFNRLLVLLDFNVRRLDWENELNEKVNIRNNMYSVLIG